MSWWQRLWQKTPELTGAPSGRRTKTYSASSGYVYQYSFRGMRRYQREGDDVFEYAFEATSGRGPIRTISVMLRVNVIAQWEAAHARSLTASERFGIAKMSLKSAFDEWVDPLNCSGEIYPELHEIEAIAAILDL